MFCPRCGQEQVSTEIKFCSRCGFPLGLVSEVLSHGGFLPQLAELYKDKRLLTRKNGILFSFLWFIFFAPFLSSIFGGVMEIEELAIVSALIGVFGGLMILITSIVLLKSAPKDQNYLDQNPANPGHKNLKGNKQNALPPRQTQPVSSFIPPVGSWKTGELTESNSVTEETTKLIKKEKEQ